MQMRFKRVADIIASTALLLGLAPILLLTAMGIVAAMGGPILFRQRRAGLHGRAFTLIKFRTMDLSRDLAGKLLPDDVRLTRLGGFLRKTSLDELPQLWNVLKGEMSLVGPRPLMAEYLGRYTPRQERRHEVRPGITGWVQVNGRNSLEWEEKFELDIWYVEHRCLRLDLKILFRTAVTLFKRAGISHSDAATMPEYTGCGRP
jgi:lipopolysaccharide/colanic/teichoic acid biosynthesis glycosyltransferase